MSKLQNVWVFAEKAEAVNELCAGVAQLGEKVSVIWAGSKELTCDADEVYFLGELNNNKILENYIPSIIQLVKTAKPDLLLVGISKKGRLIAGALAAACGTSVLTDISEIAVDDAVQTKRMVYGGAAFRTEKAPIGVAIACVGEGVFDTAGSSNTPKFVDVPNVEPVVRVECIEKRPKVGESVNLSAAKKVVGVGRGFSSADSLKMANDLAAAFGAEVGCSRPIAEEEQWMAKERYIGVSGQMLKPEIYFGIGISGQVQHMVGVNQARTIVAINKDKNAPIFKQADYGIVGDINKILPALTAMFNN